MRVLAIGDIHGCLTALKALEAAVRFQADDLVVTLGDYIDRGPDTRGVINWLIDYRRRNPERMLNLQGNHELMMKEARRGGISFHTWFGKGGAATLRSYTADDQPTQAMEIVTAEHRRFLEEELLPYFETETHLFVHAGASPHLPLSRQSAYMLYWEKFESAERHDSGKIMICGHTSQFSGVPKDRGFAVCIDTRAYDGEWLTCLDVISRRYWQANQRGEVREGNLDALPS